MSNNTLTRKHQVRYHILAVASLILASLLAASIARAGGGITSPVPDQTQGVGGSSYIDSPIPTDNSDQTLGVSNQTQDARVSETEVVDARIMGIVVSRNPSSATLLTRKGVQMVEFSTDAVYKQDNTFIYPQSLKPGDILAVSQSQNGKVIQASRQSGIFANVLYPLFILTFLAGLTSIISRSWGYIETRGLKRQIAQKRYLFS